MTTDTQIGPAKDITRDQAWAFLETLVSWTSESPDGNPCGELRSPGANTAIKAVLGHENTPSEFDLLTVFGKKCRDDPHGRARVWRLAQYLREVTCHAIEATNPGSHPELLTEVEEMHRQAERAIDALREAITRMCRDPGAASLTVDKCLRAINNRQAIYRTELDRLVSLCEALDVATSELVEETVRIRAALNADKPVAAGE